MLLQSSGFAFQLLPTGPMRTELGIRDEGWIGTQGRVEQMLPSYL